MSASSGPNALSSYLAANNAPASQIQAVQQAEQRYQNQQHSAGLANNPIWNNFGEVVGWTSGKSYTDPNLNSITPSGGTVVNGSYIGNIPGVGYSNGQSITSDSGQIVQGVGSGDWSDVSHYTPTPVSTPVSTPGSTPQTPQSILSNYNPTNIKQAVSSYTPVTTPTTQEGTDSNLLKKIAVSLRDWWGNQGIGDVGYDQSTGTVTLGGKQFTSGNIPGTYFDAASGTHYVTDSTALLSALGVDLGPTTVNPTPVVEKTKENPLGLTDEEQALLNMYEVPNMEDLYAQMMAGLPQFDTVSPISYNEAISQATSQIDPIYQISLKTLLQDVANDQIKRGFFGQLPAAAFTTEAVANLEAGKNSDIAKLASELVSQSSDSAYKANSLNLEKTQQAASLITQALQSAQQASESRRTTLASILSNRTAQANADREYGLNVSKYNLDKQQLGSSISAQQMSDAINRTDLLGYVTDADAAILGVPAGTPSWEAKQAVLKAASSGASGKKTTDDDVDDATLWNNALIEAADAITMGQLTVAQAKAKFAIRLKTGSITQAQYNQAAALLWPKKKTQKDVDKEKDAKLKNAIHQGAHDVYKSAADVPVLYPY